MLCPNCNLETFIDHVKTEGDTTRYTYVCMNKFCTEYRKGFTLTGEQVTARIKEKKE